MNFFNSVFSEDPDPQGSEPDNAAGRDYPPAEHGDDPSGAGAWDFGGLMKTLCAKSESIMEIYRRDLQEFGTGLKKEIEVAHGSIETVGHVIDQFGNTVIKGTAQIISQGKEAILDSDHDNNNYEKMKKQGSLNSRLYNRFDAQVRAIQGDPSTYTEVPEDLDRYEKWKSEFSLEGKGEEMEGFLRENDAMESVYKRVVPNTVDRETFWCRYYYKVYKLKKAEDVRARLVRRMSLSREEEELSWDVEDEDQEEEYVGGSEKKGRGGGSEMQDGGFDADGVVGIKRLNVEEESKVEKKDGLLQGNEMGRSVAESKVDKNSEVVQGKGDGGSKKTINQVDKAKDSAADSDEKMVMERKGGDGKSLPVATSQHEEEEDLEWDEIEDLSSIEEKKAMQSGGGSPSKVDLRKRLSAAEEEEDLSWDIEDDDDEPAKA